MITQHMLIERVVERHPETLPLLKWYGFVPRYAHLSIALAAEATNHDLPVLLSALRASCTPESAPRGSYAQAHSNAVGRS